MPWYSPLYSVRLLSKVHSDIPHAHCTSADRYTYSPPDLCSAHSLEHCHAVVQPSVQRDVAQHGAQRQAGGLVDYRYLGAAADVDVEIHEAVGRLWERKWGEGERGRGGGRKDGLQDSMAR